MEIDDVIPELRNYVREQFKISNEDPDFTDDVHLFNYGYVDSFGAVDLTAFVETRFTINISESDMVVYPLNTLREIATFVAKRKNGLI